MLSVHKIYHTHKVYQHRPLILLAMGYIVPLVFFLENGLGIKWPTKVDMPLNKETKLNQTNTDLDHSNFFIESNRFV